jgi:ABC-2 type transport system permease protein
VVTLDLSRGSAAAPAGRRVWAQAVFDTRNALRNGENLLLTLVIPVAVLLILLLTPMGDARTPGQSLVAAGSLAVLATAFTSQAITTGFDRRYGVLRLLGLSPLGAKGLLVARALVSLLIITGQVAILVVLTVTVGGWSPPSLAAVVQAGVVVCLGVWAYTAWALLLAGALRAEATLAVANAVFLVLMFGGGLAVPLDSLPWAGLAQWLPSGAMVAGLGGQPWQWTALGVLALWGLVGAVLTARWFRWES